jgi:hypothetical protein
MFSEGVRVVTRQDCYRTLGLSQNASQREVHRAFRRLAFRFHPDRNGGDEVSRSSFCRVTEAYSMLLAVRGRSNSDEAGSICSRCGKFDLLFAGLDGRMSCVTCLLNRRRRFLPAPPVSAIRCFAAVILLLAALAMIGLAVVRDSGSAAVASVAMCLVALLALSVNVLTADVIE